MLLDAYRTQSADSAFKYSEIYRIANDSLFSAKAIQQTQQMTFLNELQQQQAEEERKNNLQYAIIATRHHHVFHFLSVTEPNHHRE